MILRLAALVPHNFSIQSALTNSGELRRLAVPNYGYLDDPDFVFHALRHTFISMMAMNGVSMANLQQLGGHKSMQATMRYIHVSAHDTENESINIMNKIAFE